MSRPKAEERKLQVLRDLTQTLRVHAERMKLEDRHNPLCLHPGVAEDNISENVEISKNTKIPKPGVRSPARRRRQAREVVRSYRPDYTWNRGGRLKELRIRRHFALKQYRLVFGILHDEWYSRRVEWRLMVRAECHDRYRLWNRVMKALRQYVTLQRHKKQKWRTAISFYERMLVSKAVYSWRMSMDYMRERSKRIKLAGTHYKETTTRRVFDNWREALHAKMERVALENRVFRSYEMASIAKAWLIWRNRFDERVASKAKVLQAQQHARFGVLRRCVLAWKAFVLNRQNIRSHYVKLQADYESNVKLQFLRRWRFRLALKRDIESKEQQIEELAQRSKLRSALSHWKHYVVLRNQAQEQDVLSQNYADFKLLKFGFAGMRLAVIQRRIKLMREQKAATYHNLTLQRRVWDCWVNRCDQCEEMRLYHLTKKAMAHFRIAELRKALSNWKLYIDYRRMEKAKEMKADIFHSSVLLSQTFYSWVGYTQVEQWVSDANQHAAAMFRGRMEDRYFQRWREMYEKSMEVREMDRMAVLHWEQTLGLRALATWRERTRERLNDYENMTLASDHYRTSLLRRIVGRWKSHATDLLQQQSHSHKAVRHRNHYLMSRVISIWRSYLARRKYKASRMRMAITHNHQCVLKPVFEAWLDRTKLMENRRRIAYEKVKEDNSKLMRHCVEMWSAEARRLRIQDFSVNALVCRKQTDVLRKVLTAWREIVAGKMEKKCCEEEKIQQVQDILNHQCLKAAFVTWHSARDACLLAQLKWSQATVHWERKCVMAMISTWKDYVMERKRKRMLTQKAELACKHRLRVKYYLRWRLEMTRATIIQQKSHVALCQWSIILERKCLIAWYMYAQQSKAKRLKYEQAMEAFKNSLVKVAVRKMIIVADRRSQMRIKLATDRHTQDMHRGLLAAQRCFYHWKTKSISSQQKSVPSAVRFASKIRLPEPTCVKGDSIPQAAKSSARSPRKQLPKEFSLPAPPVLVSRSPAKQRPGPRQPAFLMASLERDGLYRPDSMSADIVKPEEAITLSPRQYMPSSHGYSVTKLFSESPTKRPHAVTDHESNVICSPSPSHVVCDLRSKMASPSTFITKDKSPSPTHLLLGRVPPLAGAGASLVRRPFTPEESLLPPAHFSPERSFCKNTCLLPPSAFTEVGTGDHETPRFPSLDSSVVPVEKDYLLEIEQIKGKLLEYKNKRKVLREKRAQLRLLTECLSDSPDISIIPGIQLEIDQLAEETAILTLDLEESKKLCATLSDRLHQLALLM